MSSASLDHALAAVQAGALDRAFAICRAILEREPGNLNAMRLAARILELAGELPQAVRVYEAVAARAPRAASDRYNLATALARLGHDEAALAEFQAAVALDPGDAAALCNLGIVLRRLGRTAEAIAALEGAVALDPGSAAAQTNLGNALDDAGRLDEAIACHRAAHAAAPENRAMRLNLGNALCRIGRNAEAAAVVEGGVESGTPDAAARLLAALYLPLVPRDEAEIDAARARLAQAMDALEAGDARIADPLAIARTPFHLAYHGRDDRALQERFAALCRTLAPTLAFTAPHVATPRPPGRIRVGFVSEHFRAHTILRLNAGLLAGLDRQRFAAVILATPHADRALLEPLGWPIEVLRPHDLAAAREAVARHALDVLYYTDIGMAPFTMLLAHARLARVQCVAWGHPVTTGIPTVDYFLSCDAMEPDGAERHYSERLVRLQGPTVCYERPERPERAAARARHGFAGETVYLCPQSPFKFHPAFDAALRAILRGDPAGTLSIIAGEHREITERLRARLLGPAPELGPRVRVHGAMGRAAFIDLLAAADVMLDPFHYSGGNTSLEALAVGTPIVTWPGAFMRARHTFGFYRLMGYDGCIAGDPAHYVALALALGRDPEARQAASAAILARCDVLFASRSAVAATEAFLAQAVAAAEAAQR